MLVNQVGYQSLYYRSKKKCPIEIISNQNQTINHNKLIRTLIIQFGFTIISVASNYFISQGDSSYQLYQVMVSVSSNYLYPKGIIILNCIKLWFHKIVVLHVKHEIVSPYANIHFCSFKYKNCLLDRTFKKYQRCITLEKMTFLTRL